ncbi:MAG: hypothetical protein PGN13_16235 [Patulibacter minatonensis]
MSSGGDLAFTLGAFALLDVVVALVAEPAGGGLRCDRGAQRAVAGRLQRDVGLALAARGVDEGRLGHGHDRPTAPNFSTIAALAPRAVPGLVEGSAWPNSGSGSKLRSTNRTALLGRLPRICPARVRGGDAVGDRIPVRVLRRLLEGQRADDRRLVDLDRSAVVPGPLEAGLHSGQLLSALGRRFRIDPGCDLPRAGGR